MRLKFIFILYFPLILFSQNSGEYTPLQFLYFSSQAYEDREFLDKIPPSFKIIKDIDSLDSEGYFEDKVTDYQGIAYIDTVFNVIIVSHRGTEFSKMKDIYADKQIVKANMAHNKKAKNVRQYNKGDTVAQREAMERLYSENILKSELNQFYKAHDFVELLKQKYTTTEYRYLHVGHSLGGAIAQLVAGVYQEQGITFDAPGVESLALALAIPNGEYDIINYVVKNSAISNWKGITRGHLGRLVPIYPYPPHDLVKNNPLGAGMYHKIVNISNAFDQENGEVLGLEYYAELCWEANKPIFIGTIPKKPQNQFKNFKIFKDRYIQRYIYKTTQ